ncbi:MAG: exo-alpha-sialidase, partial [Chloroflexi bacterium]|nr:exo-alpha-sialidase [Chloroflexota bacterium]
MPSSRRIVSLPESNIRCCFTTAIALLALIVVPGLRPASTLGQSGDEPWSPSLQLGVPDEASAFPVLVPDTSGGLHLFWVGERSADISPSGPAYYHRYWDGREWSPPVDILTSPHRDGFLPVDTAGGPSVALDSRGWLHVIWVGSSGRMYYSSAPTDRASSARAWSAPRVLSFSALGTTAMVAGQDSTLHLLYDRALDNPGVSYMQSADGGETWSEPVDVSGEITPDEFAVSVRLAIDGRGWLHAGWHHRRVTPERIFPIIARYARSEDGGRNWSEPMTVEAEVGAAFVNPVVDKQDNVHLFWIGPGGQRYHRWSSDGGYTWTEPERIFPVFAGAWNGWVAAAVDSAGTLHAVTG